MPDMEYKTTPIEFKAEGDQGQYAGHFSVFGNVDDGGDIVHPGAFAKTIQERGSRVKVFYAHDWQKLIGPPPDTLKEDQVGLFAAGRLTLASFWGREAWELMKDGALSEGSFGFQSIKWDWDEAGNIRNLRELKLYEISPVPLGMNPLTELQAIKALLDGRPAGETLYGELSRRIAPLFKGAIPPKETPKAADDTEWDAGAVLREVEGASDLRKIHAWVDEDGDPESKSSYKLPHHLADGKVVLAGVQAAGNSLMGSRNSPKIPEGDIDGVKRHLALHYRQFDKTPPWEEEAGLQEQIELLMAVTGDLKVSALVSPQQFEQLQNAKAELDGAIATLKQMRDAAEPEDHSAHLQRRLRAAQLALSLAKHE